MIFNLMGVSYLEKTDIFKKKIIFRYLEYLSPICNILRESIIDMDSQLPILGIYQDPNMIIINFWDHY